MELITISYCSQVEDMTPYLVFGDLCMRWIRINATELATAYERADPDFPSNCDNAFKHLVVAIQSCAICLASFRSNVYKTKGSESDLNKQRFFLETCAGLNCKCGKIHDDIKLAFTPGRSSTMIQRS